MRSIGIGFRLAPCLVNLSALSTPRTKNIVVCLNFLDCDFMYRILGMKNYSGY